ncbi:MAG: hypothetical protein NVSMB12_19900 [Acidimicrobiales bacterium]
MGVDRNRCPIGTGLSIRYNIRVPEASACEQCGEPGAGRDGSGALVCESCALSAPDGVTLTVLPGPVLAAGDVHVSWERAGELLATSAAATLFWRLGPVSEESGSDPDGPEPIGEDVMLGPTLPVEGGPLPPLRDPVDDDEAEAWAEAVSLLAECLPPSTRPACPAEELRLAAAAARTGYGDGDGLWVMVGDGAGWDGAAPQDDRDLWTGAAMCLASVAVEALEEKLAECLDIMEPSDWLSTVVELVRSGVGALADPENLLALSARCLDVDSAAVDPGSAAQMTLAFEAVLPVWRGLGAVDRTGHLTTLGQWGLPLALARAWGGWLGEAEPD